MRKVLLILLILMVTGIIIGGFSLVTYYTNDKVIPGQTVSDPGVSGRMSKYTLEDTVYPVNWHEIAESGQGQSEETQEYLRFRKTFRGDCRRQIGAKMIALEQFENNVLVKYFNPEIKEVGNCPSNVVFWFSVDNFLNAESEYKEAMKAKAKQDESFRKSLEKKRKKDEVVRRYISPPPGGWGG